MASTIITKYGSGAPLASDLVRGELAVDTENGRLYTETSGGAVVEIGLNPGGNLDVTGTVTADGLTVDGNILLNSEGNELQFNTSSTPVNKIYSDDTYTTNGLTISADNGITLKSTSNYLLLDDTGTNEMVLNVDGGERVRVTSTGIDVTGTVTADGLTVDGDGTLQTSDGAILTLKSTDTVVVFEDIYGSLQFESSDATNPGVVSKIDAIASGGNGGSILKFYTSDNTSTLERLNISFNGDISFYEDTGTTAKLFWDASAESLGIGTSSPQQLLHVSQGTNATATTIRIENTDTTIDAAQTANAIEFYTNDASAGGTGVTGKISHVAVNAGSTYALTFSSYDGSSLSEAMRIDSSGNLLVGKTANDNSTVGGSIRAGESSFVSGDSRALTVVRTNVTSGGDLMEFRQSGTTVGSIGTSGGTIYAGKGGSGLIFNDGGTKDLIPYSLTAADTVDNSISLGISSKRFKDLYLSGGVYVGGTGAANYLDDYEEGTWTPEYAPGTGSFTTITYDGQTGHYVKVGALVTAWCYIRTASLDTTGASGTISITGFPFAANTGSSVGTGSCSAQDAWTTRMPTITWISNSSAALGYGDDASTSYNGISVPNMTTGTSKNRLYAVWSYQTTS